MRPERKAVYVSRDIRIEATESAAWDIALMLPASDGFTIDLCRGITEAFPDDELAEQTKGAPPA